VLGCLAAFSTAFYSTRLLYLVFLSKANGNKITIVNAHEGSWRMTLPLFLLSIASLSVGYLSKELFIGFGTHFWGSSIFIRPENYSLVDIEFINLGYKVLPLLLTILGSSISYFIYRYQAFNFLSIKKSFWFKDFYSFFNKKWYFDRVYNELVSQNFLSFSYHYAYKTVDRGLLEKLGPSGIILVLQSIIKYTKTFQTGFILHYLVYILVGILCFILFSLQQNLFFIPLFIAYYTFNNDYK
jgi:NADH-ubiquinone oxidoreductase chain 5